MTEAIWWHLYLKEESRGEENSTYNGKVDDNMNVRGAVSSH